MVEYFRSVRFGRSTVSTSYLPGIDGLRAIAVLAVLLFHGGVERARGGFLGVEVFFVISGYLITLLLLREWRETGRIDLRHFWVRRARRLLPALAALVVLVLAYAVLFLPDEVTGLRSDALSAASYITNWWLIFGDQPYFEAMGRPSLLQHLWSLAVEEQFYLLWPVIFLGLLKLGGRRLALVATLGGAAASYGLMWALHNPEADPSRIYYGTDTRAGALLLGAALAMLWDPRAVRHPRSWLVPVAFNAVAVAALTGMVAAFLALEESTSWLYPWGFVATSAATLAAIAAVVHPASSLTNLALGSKPMRWAGTRSYALYLWHWPIFQVTRAGLDVPFDGLDLLLGRLALTAVAAEVSYRFIEQPIRTGTIKRTVRTSLDRFPDQTRVVSFGSGLAAMALVVMTVTAHPAATASYLQDGEGFHGVVGTPPPATPTLEPWTPSPTEAPTETPTERPTESPAATPTPAPPEAPPPPPTDPAPPPPPPPTQAPPEIPPPTGASIYAIGDSVLLGAAPYLGVAGPVEVDAQVGRHVSGVISQLRAMRAAGRLPQVIVVHTGNNGPLTSGQVDQIMEIAGDARVVFVTVRVGKPWEDTSNDSIWGATARYGNARVADWYGASRGRPELFIEDGIHLRPAGAELFAALIAAAIAS